MTPNWRHLGTIGAVLLMSILVATAPGAASSHLVVASEHTTDTDFNNATTLENLTVSGTGDAAQLELRNGSERNTTTRPADNDVLNDRTAEHGARIKVDSSIPIRNLTAYVSDNTDGATTGEIRRYSDDQTIDTASVQNGKVNFDAELQPGTQYYILLDNPDGSWDAGRVDQTQISGDHITWVYGWAGNSDDTNHLYAVDEIDFTYNTSTPNATYVSQAHDADKIEQGVVDLDLDGVNATVKWQGHDGSSWTTVSTTEYTSSGTKTDSLSGGYGKWRVNVTFAPSTTYGSANLSSEAVKFDAREPDFDNSSEDPPGGSTVNEDPVEFSINLTDADFATSQGDSVTATLYVEGSSVGSDTLTSNGAATVTHSVGSLGDVDYHWEATDDYGETGVSQTYTITTPSNITFRREDNASEIVTGTDITVTFYSEDGQTIIERSDDNQDGNISLSGLPNTEFVVTIEATGYYDRRVFIESIYDQENIYLLNTSDHGDAVDTTFVYEDRTGSFPPDETALRVQRAVDPDNDSNFTWQTVAGDYWGAAGEFPFTGEYQARYRIVIENTDTNSQRILGTHIPTSDGTKNIIVGQIQWGARNGTGRYFDAEMDTENNQINFLYVDPENETRDVRVRVHAPRNESDEIYDQNFTTGPYGELEVEIPVTNNQSEETWVVNYTADHDTHGEISGQTTVGGNPFGLPVDPWLLGTLSWVLVTFVATLYGPRTATMGAWALVGMAGVLMLFQWVTIPVSAFIVGVAIAAGGTFYREGMP